MLCSRLRPLVYLTMSPPRSLLATKGTESTTVFTGGLSSGEEEGILRSKMLCGWDPNRPTRRTLLYRQVHSRGTRKTVLPYGYFATKEVGKQYHGSERVILGWSWPVEKELSVIPAQSTLLQDIPRPKILPGRTTYYAIHLTRG